MPITKHNFIVKDVKDLADTIRKAFVIAKSGLSLIHILILLDLKQIDEEQHQILTGCTGKNILELAQYLSEIHKPVWIRHVLVPGGSDKDEYLDRLNAFIQTLKNVERVEVLPYHTLGEYKWKELGMEYPLVGVEPPTKERIENAKRRLGC